MEACARTDICLRATTTRAETVDDASIVDERDCWSTKQGWRTRVRMRISAMQKQLILCMYCNNFAMKNDWRWPLDTRGRKHQRGVDES